MMTGHMWGDDWEHWNDLYAAENFLYDYVYRYSRCKLLSKEKYGTLRYEWMFPPKSGIYVRPWTCIRIPFLDKRYDVKKQKFFYAFDLSKGRKGWPIWRWCDSWLHRKWENYGWRTLDRAIVLACRKWPQCRKEILADWTFRKY